MKKCIEFVIKKNLWQNARSTKKYEILNKLLTFEDGTDRLYRKVHKVINHYSPYNNPEERNSHLLSSGNLISHSHAFRSVFNTLVGNIVFTKKNRYTNVLNNEELQT